MTQSSTMPGPAEFIHGDMLIGSMINIFLYGIMVAQVYIYYTTYKRDNIFIKIFVFALFLVDAVNTAFEAVYIYMSLIRHFDDAQYLETTNWMAGIAPASTGVIALMVQLFYAWRIHVLTRNWFLVAVVALLSVTSAVFAVLTSWETVVKDPEWTTIHEASGVITVWLTCAVAADIVITVILVRHLQRRHKNGLHSTDMMVNRIIRITMQTCLATTVIATFDLAFFLGSSSGTHMAFMLILCKLYSNSLVSNLNSRSGWKYDTAATPECESSFRAAHARSHPTEIELAISHSSMGKPEICLDSTISGKNPRTGVFVHIESCEMRDITPQDKDPEG